MDKSLSISPISDADWRSRLTPEQYRINRQGGTECAFTQELLNEKRPGTYYDVTGEQPLFRSEDKFESGTRSPPFPTPTPITDDRGFFYNFLVRTFLPR